MQNDKLAQYRRTVDGSFSLSELKEMFPAQWQSLAEELTPLCRPEESQKLAAALHRISAEADAFHSRVTRSRGNQAVVKVALPYVVRHRMARLWLTNSCLLSVADAGKDGKAKLSFWDGFLMQRLLFRRGMERKPVSLAWFRVVWPMVRPKQRSLMLYLVQRKGIYCFYSDRLVEGLARLISNRPCLEIAAGDGTLTRFLRQAGISVRATDNQSWGSDIQYPDFVEKAGAEESLRKYAPPVVICSWPPSGNTFERYVFACPSVEEYVVIASRQTFACGNWELYGKQKDFEWKRDETLSRWLLPPEVEGTVLVFRRTDIDKRGS